MGRIKNFNQLNMKNEDVNYPNWEPPVAPFNVKVKDLIEYFQTLDPEMEVVLDKEGWDYENTPLETLQNSYVFSVSTWGKPPFMTINN